MELTTRELKQIMVPSAANEYWRPLSVQVLTKNKVVVNLTTSASVQKPLSGLGHTVQVPPEGIDMQIVCSGLNVSPDYIDLFWKKDNGETNCVDTFNITQRIFVSKAEIEKRGTHLRIDCAFLNAPLETSRAVALVMVTHKRLGAISPLASLFANMDLQYKLLSYLKDTLIDYSTFYLQWPITFQTGRTLKVWAKMETLVLQMEEEPGDDVPCASMSKRKK